MSWLGIIRNGAGIVHGLVEGDLEHAGKKALGLAFSVGGTVISHVVHEHAGRHLSDHGERIAES